MAGRNIARLTARAARGPILPMKWQGLFVLASLGFAVGACSEESVSTKGVIGNYNVMISQNGKSDPDVMSILTGSNNSLLISFIAGISTDADGPNPTGLRASIGQGQSITISKQPAHIDHSTGKLNGTLWGEGKVTGFDVTMTLHYLPTNFAIGQMTDPDGGVVLSRPDMAPATSLDYELTGEKQM
jgi:hypothetical protein